MRKPVQRFLLFACAAAALPFCAALALALFDVLCAVPASGAAIMTPEMLSLLGGFFAFLLAWYALPRPTRAYILGHELTHAVWGLVFGARVSRLRVQESGGSVCLTKSNVLITLAPYFFPFYTMLVVAAALLAGLFVQPLPWIPVWLFAVGFTWCFHACFTLQALMTRQPDVMEYGRLFSWAFIWIANIAGVAVWICAVSPVPFSFAAERLARRSCSSYSAALSLGRAAWDVSARAVSRLGASR